MRLVQEAREQDPELSLNAAVVRIGQRTGVNADTLDRADGQALAKIAPWNSMLMPRKCCVSTQFRKIIGASPFLVGTRGRVVQRA